MIRKLFTIIIMASIIAVGFVCKDSWLDVIRDGGVYSVLFSMLLVAACVFFPTGFSPSLAHRVLNQPAVRNRLIDNIVQTISRKGYAGVNIDFEQILEEDRDLFSFGPPLRRERLHLRPELRIACLLCE